MQNLPTPTAAELGLPHYLAMIIKPDKRPVQPVSTVTREKVVLETVSCSVFTQRSLAAP